MTILGDLTVRIGADLKGLSKGLTKAAAKLKSAGKSMQNVGKSLTAGITLPLLAAGVAVLKLAADAEESENLFEVSMGSMANAARNFSEELSTALGLNAFEVRKITGTFNQMLSSMGLSEQAAFDMSTSMTQLTFDMASFFNLNPDDAFKKLQAGITGEAEPLKRLGILIDENTIKQAAYNNGIAEFGEELNQTQKIQARFVAIMEQTKNAQGDLARTQDSLTNQVRILKSQMIDLGIQIGLVLIPFVQTLLQKINPLITTMKDWVGRFREATPQVKLLVIGGLALLAALGPLVFILGKLVVVGASLLTILSGISLTVVGVVVAVGLLAFVTASVVRAWDRMGIFLKSVIAGMKFAWLSFTAAVFDSSTKLLQRMPVIGQAFKDVATAMKTTAEQAGVEFTDFTAEFQRQGGFWNGTIEGMKAKFNEFAQSFGVNSKKISKEDLAKLLAGFKTTFAGMGVALKENVNTVKLWAETLKNQFTNVATGVADILAGGTTTWAGLLTSFLTAMLNKIISVVIGSMLSLKALAGAFKFLAANPFLAALAIGGLIVGVAAIRSRFAGTQLADGGIATSSTIAEIGEKGPEAVIPLNNPKAVRKLTGLGGRTQNISLEVAGEVIARAAVQGMPDELRMFGIET